jgi:hypothetical protein
MTASNEFFSAAGLFFEKQRGVKMSQHELSIIDDAGLDKADPNDVGDFIWKSLPAVRDVQTRITAYWALGKRREPEDRQKLIAALAEELPRNARVAFQIMVAIENYDASVFDPSRKGRSFDEDELNRADALHYLSRKH